MIGSDAAEMSEFGRLFGVFTRPKEVMRDVALRPSWLVPLLLAGFVAITFTVVLRPGLSWTREQTILATAGSVAAVFLRTLFAAVVLTLVTRFSVSFWQVFAVACYARMPGVALMLLAIVLFPLGHKPATMYTNLAVFLNPVTTPKPVYTLAIMVDCILFWQLSLMALGLKTLGVPAGVSRTAVVVLWVLLAIFQVGWVVTHSVGR